METCLFSRHFQAISDMKFVTHCHVKDGFSHIDLTNTFVINQNISYELLNPQFEKNLHIV